MVTISRIKLDEGKLMSTRHFIAIFILAFALAAQAREDNSLFLAIKSGNLDTVKQLLTEKELVNFKEEGSRITPLMEAAKSGQEEIARYLLQQGADVNARDILGESALIYAIEAGNVKIVQMLIDKGADVNMRTKLGVTPLVRAATLGRRKIVEILLSHGADIEAKNLDGKVTPLSKAAQRGHLETVKLLLDNGADIDFKIQGVWTPLVLAAMNGHLDVVKLLMQRGADINIRTPLGETALMIAIDNGHPDVAQFLIDNGAEVNVRDKFKKTALMRAAARGDSTLVQSLLDHGADFKLTTEKGIAAFDLAQKFEQEPVVNLLRKLGADTTMEKRKRELAKAKAERVALIPSEESDYDEPPKPKGGLEAVQKQLKYPKDARKKGLEGKVIVDAYISQRGRVLKTKIAKSMGDKKCDKAAISAVKKVKWQPATKAGKRVKGWVGVPVIFKLEEKKKEPEKGKSKDEKDK